MNPLYQRCSAPSLIDIDTSVLKKKFNVKFRQRKFAIWLLSALGKGKALYLIYLESPSPMDACASLVEIGLGSQASNQPGKSSAAG